MQVEKIDTFSGHRGAVYALDKGESNEIVFSGASDGMLVQWNLSKPDVGKGIAQFSKGIFSIKYIKETHQLWIATHLDGIHVIDLQTFKVINTFPMPHVSFFTFEQIGNKLVAGNSSGQVFIFEILSNQLVKSFKISPKSIRKIISFCSENFLAASSDGTIRLVDFEGNILHQIQAHQDTVFSLVHDATKNVLYSVGKDAKVKKWSIFGQEIILLSELVGHIFPIHDIVFDQTKNLLATSSMDKTVKIWDAEEFKLLKVIDFARHGGHKNAVNKLYWSDYQDFLVSASDDKKISVWKVNV